MFSLDADELRQSEGDRLFALVADVSHVGPLRHREDGSRDCHRPAHNDARNLA